MIELLFKDSSDLDYSGLFKLNCIFEDIENNSVFLLIYIINISQIINVSLFLHSIQSSLLKNKIKLKDQSLSIHFQYRI